MHYIVLDLEYNQPSNVKSKDFRSKYIKNEVIEIGAIKADETLKFISGFKCYIKPKFQPQINEHVLNLLGFKNEDYINTNGTTLNHAMELFKYFVGDDDFKFLLWGDQDVKVLIQNCGVLKIDYSWIKNKQTVDIQQHIIKQNNMKDYPALDKVAVDMNIQIEEDSLHHAYYDSLYTLKIAQKLGTKIINSKIVKHKKIIIIKKVPMELQKEINKRINCPKCGKFMKIIGVSKTTKTNAQKNDPMIQAYKVAKCNKCNIFLCKKTLYDGKNICIKNKQVFHTNKNGIKYIMSLLD
jgi:inhibitor of KinA sporulation pathway (predicted exonuclease)